MYNVLIIEDDEKLNDGIMLALKSEELVFRQCYTIEEANKVISEPAECFNVSRVDLIILDVNLPDGNGLDFLRELRKTQSTPVILLTANNMELDIVTGLELGADDYITKPFSLMVLRARVNVQIRKIQGNFKNKGLRKFKIDNFDFDFENMIFTNKGQQIDLSKIEQKLLLVLVSNMGMTMTRDMIIDKVWSGDTDFVEEHALTVSIKRLRYKLGEDGTNPQYIKTVYGIGYTWAVN
ncbi:MAG: response regulator transcription factor [Anaerovoracaceae bacterium]